MAQVTLSLSSLGELHDGAAEAIIDKAIAAAVADLDDRGDDEKPRIVEIKLTLTKLESGHVATEIEAGAKVPKYRTAPTLAKLAASRGGELRLLFQTHDPDDPDQRTLDEAHTNGKE